MILVAALMLAGCAATSPQQTSCGDNVCEQGTEDNPENAAYCPKDCPAKEPTPITLPPKPPPQISPPTLPPPPQNTTGFCSGAMDTTCGQYSQTSPATCTAQQGCNYTPEGSTCQQGISSTTCDQLGATGSFEEITCERAGCNWNGTTCTGTSNVQCDNLDPNECANIHAAYADTCLPPGTCYGTPIPQCADMADEASCNGVTDGTCEWTLRANLHEFELNDGIITIRNAMLYSDPQEKGGSDGTQVPIGSSCTIINSTPVAAQDWGHEVEGVPVVNYYEMNCGSADPLTGWMPEIAFVPINLHEKLMFLNDIGKAYGDEIYFGMIEADSTFAPSKFEYPANPPLNPTCLDSDNGLNLNVAGYAESVNSRIIDSCDAKLPDFGDEYVAIDEAICDAQGNAVSVRRTCPTGQYCKYYHNTISGLNIIGAKCVQNPAVNE